MNDVVKSPFSLFSFLRVQWVVTFLWLASGLIVAFGQPAWSHALSLMTTYFGYALLWASLLLLPQKKLRFLLGCFWGMSVQLIQLSWLVSFYYHGLYIVAVYLLISLWLGFQFGLLSFALPKNPSSLCHKHILFLSCFAILLEWGRHYVLCGFAWNPIGLSVTSTSYFSQFASISGVLGLSFLVLYLNGLMLLFWVHPNKKIYLGLFLFFVGGIHAFGFYRIHYYHVLQEKEQSAPLRVALVQTGLKEEQKLFLKHKENHFLHPLFQWSLIFENVFHHLKESPPHILVLPEAAVSYGAYSAIYPLDQVQEVLTAFLPTTVDLTPFLKEPYVQRSNEGEYFGNNLLFAKILSTYLSAKVILGLDYKDQDHRSYNAIFYVDPHKEKPQIYAKQILLPLAEALPFTFLERLANRYGVTGFFTPGTKKGWFSGEPPMSVSICYEECFASLIRNYTQQGTGLHINVTNDVWFPSTKLAKQHFDHGKIRAIENGFTQLRACNTGITAIINPLGQTLARIGQNQNDAEWQKGVLLSSIFPVPYPTLFMKYGYAPLLIFSGLIVIYFFVWTLNRQRTSL